MEEEEENSILSWCALLILGLYTGVALLTYLLTFFPSPRCEPSRTQARSSPVSTGIR